MTKDDYPFYWIVAAETRYGMYDPRTSKVRAYFLPLLDSERFKPVPVPQELTDLGFFNTGFIVLHPPKFP